MRFFKPRGKVSNRIVPTADAAATAEAPDIPSNRTSANPAEMLETLRALGMSPRHIVDIGANRGSWSRHALNVFPQVSLTIFEPQQCLKTFHADLLGNDKVDFRYLGVGDFDGTLSFTQHSSDDSSSFIYTETEALEQGLPQIQMDICRLDTALHNSPFGPPEIVKIDAEGFDLKVLDGAPRTLETAEIVAIEAAVACPTYPNTFEVVTVRMNEMGFRLFDITDLNRGPGRGVLWLVEAAYVRRSSAMDIASRNIA